MKINLGFILTVLIVLTGPANAIPPVEKVTSKEVVLPHDEYLALEIINPRTIGDFYGRYVTTIYLIRNISDQIVTLTGGPKYHWSTASGESGADGPSFINGPTPGNTLYSTGVVRNFILRPGQACAYVSENYFESTNEYPLKIRFDRNDGGMMFETWERAKGFAYYVEFSLSYFAEPEVRPGETVTYRRVQQPPCSRRR